MTVTINTPTQVGDGAYRYTWSSTESDPTYYVYENGELVDVTQAEERVVYVSAGTWLILEVLDDSGATPTDVPTGYLYLCWYPATDFDAAYYVVDEYVDSAWTQRAKLADDGRGFWQWRTRWLEDVTTHIFRVRALGDNGNYGDTETFTRLVVRYPDEPSVSYSYDSGTGEITVSEA